MAPRLRCDVRLLFHLFAGVDHPLRPETLHGAEAQIQHRIVTAAHGLDKELHGLLFDAVFQGLLDRDVCRLQLRCEATRNEEHVALWVSSTDPLQQGRLSMDRGAIPQQHPMQEPSFSHPSAKPLDELLARALGASVAVAEAAGDLLVLWHVLQHSFRGALHNELGHDGARHGHDRRDRDISLVLGADEAHASVSLRSRPATVSQAQELRGRLVHVDDARGVDVVLRHVVHQAQSELVNVHVHQHGIRRFLGAS